MNASADPPALPRHSRAGRVRARLPLAAAALVAALAAGASADEAAPPGDATACFRRLTTALADDGMEGRGVGTAGLERAAAYLEDEMRGLGLVEGEAGYGQPFRAETGVAPGEGNALSWRVADAAEAQAATPGVDFTPLGFSSSAVFSGPLVFAGYGIRAEPLGYDDYAGLDVSGKVVLAMRYEPGERDEDSPFDGARPSRWSELRYKALVARENGAAALVLVSPPDEGDDQPDRLPLVRNEVLLSRAGLPVLQVTPSLADRWLAAAGRDLQGLRAAIDADYAPASLAIDAVRLEGRTDVLTTQAPVRNVLGVVLGAGELADEAVVVGAHYDHLGFGGTGSLEPDVVAVHNGADDNASGVAAMLCAVRELQAGLAGMSPRRTLVVAAFAAEEIGLGGSARYVEAPRVPIERTVAMVNLDMVGRLRDDELTAMGSDSALEWTQRLEPLARAAGLELSTGGDGYGPSDQMPFYQAGVPVVHLFTGSHSEYHTTADDVETLNMEGGGRVTGFLASLLADLITREENLTYQATTETPTMGGDSRGYGAYLGSIPDYSAMGSREGGVPLSGVRKGGPADLAGVRGGDVIVGLAGVEVHNLYDMTYVLREHRPGETIEVIVLRDGERLSLRAVLGRRGAAPEGEAHPAHEPAQGAWQPRAGRAADSLLDPRETHLADLRQLTFDGENAEAYFSPDGRSLIFQRTPPEGGCDQQYLLDLDGGEQRQLSSGRGRTTCGYFSWPHGERMIYATTERADAACPQEPDHSRGYVWGLHDFDLVWQAGPGAPPDPFVSLPGSYDAEATVCMQDGRVVFTSTRDGDLDLYVVDADGSNLRRLTDTPGYDGGAFFTPDCRAIVYRASRPEGEALEDYRALLAQGLVRPGALDLYWLDLDEGRPRRLTDNGRANFAPYPAPDGRSVLFSSNLGGSEREFDLYRVPVDGGEPERITFTPGFDGFPMFSPDGRWLVFASNRPGGRQTNVFIARWRP